MSTALASDEMILSVRFPKQGAGEGSSFQLFNRRHGDFALVAVAACVSMTQDCVARVRLGVSGVAPVPSNCEAIAGAFLDRRADAAWCTGLAQAVSATVKPEDDERIPALYRQELVQTMVQRALARAVECARE
jgi:carbon-monoxide dehydrogenase medium subunit